MNENVGRHNDLFQSINFKSHSGLDLSWKIEMDVLSDREWFTIKKMIMEITPPFREAVGIPRGGTFLGDLLNEHATGKEGDPVCIVDDVLTTGESMEYFVTQYRRNRRPFTAIGWVVFARGQTPDWVQALFQMPARRNEKTTTEEWYSAEDWSKRVQELEIKEKKDKEIINKGYISSYE